MNPDGLEWKRSKFNQFIKYLLLCSEKVMVLWAKEIIADSQEIKKYLDHKYGINTYCISYGVIESENIEWNDYKLPDKIKIRSL